MGLRDRDYRIHIPRGSDLAPVLVDQFSGSLVHSLCLGQMWPSGTEQLESVSAQCLLLRSGVEGPEKKVRSLFRF